MKGSDWESFSETQVVFAFVLGMEQSTPQENSRLYFCGWYRQHRLYFY